MRAVDERPAFTVVKKPFSSADHKPFTVTGPAHVHGRAIFLRPNRRFHTCRHTRVMAFPDTPYTREVVAIVRSGEPPGRSPFHPGDYPRIVLETLCNLDGDFYFYNLQPNRYFFAAEIRWLEPPQYERGTLLSSVLLLPCANPLLLTNLNSPPPTIGSFPNCKLTQLPGTSSRLGLWRKPLSPTRQALENVQPRSSDSASSAPP